MKYYRFQEEANGMRVISEEEIVKECYSYFAYKMRNKNLDNEISEQACVRDWIESHNATEVKKGK